MKYPYKDIIEKVTDKVTSNDPLSTYYRKYKFFDSLQEAVYNGLTPDQFRKLRQLITLEDNVPYWEIHHYPKFTASTVSGSAHEQWFSQDDEEHHLYFTFRKHLTPAFHQKEIEGVHYPHNGTDAYKFIGSRFNVAVIDKDYGDDQQSIPKQNTFSQFKIYILEDKDDNAETLQKLSPEIYKHLVGEDEKANIIPSKLPQMLFVAGKGAFRPVTPNANTIVCVDAHTNMGIAAGADDKNITLSGNIFINQAVMLFPLANNKIPIGKNVVIMRSSYILSSLVGDNVFIGEEVRAEEDTNLGSGCFLDSKTTITQYQDVLPAQQVSAKLPWVYNIFNPYGKFNYETFLSLAEVSKKSYLEKLEKSQ